MQALGRLRCEDKTQRLKVMNELKVRGLNDILIAVVDGLKGFPEAITTVYSQTLVQTPVQAGGQALHCSPDPQQPRLRHLERPQSDYAVDQGHLSG